MGILGGEHAISVTTFGGGGGGGEFRSARFGDADEFEAHMRFAIRRVLGDSQGGAEIADDAAPALAPPQLLNIT